MTSRGAMTRTVGGWRIAILLLGACGGDDTMTATDAAVDAITPLTPAGYAVEYADALCTKAFACRDSFPTGTGLTFEQVFGVDTTACKAKLPTAAQLEASVTAGRITFMATAAMTCLTELDGFDCPTFWNGATNNSFSTACDQATAGQVGVGGSCTIDLDCTSDDCATNNTCGA